MTGTIDRLLPDATLSVLAGAHADAAVATIHWTPNGIEATSDDDATRRAVEEILGIGDRAGLAIASAALFSSQARTTLTMRLAIAGTSSELTIHHDTRDGRARMGILHPDRREVAFASAVDRLTAGGDPFAVITLHHGHDEGRVIEQELRRLGLKPVVGDLGATPIATESYELVENE